MARAGAAHRAEQEQNEQRQEQPQQQQRQQKSKAFQLLRFATFRRYVLLRLICSDSVSLIKLPPFGLLFA